jgi:hypothetical protein
MNIIYILFYNVTIIIYNFIIKADNVLEQRETLFKLAQKGLENQAVSFDGKITDCRHVQLYDGMKFLHNESHCKIGYIKNINIHYKKIKKAK